MSRKPLSLRFVVTATLLGNTLEWYDFATFGFLVPTFARLFFPESNSWQALMHTMFALFFGSVMRPVGGILFGFIGDRFGRRLALLASVLLMTIPVFLMSVLPTYWQIGIAAPIILSVLRLFQGLAAGGEFPGAVTFLYESATPHLREFYASFAYFGVGLGILLGGIDFFFFAKDLSGENFLNYGWRIFFAMGSILGLISFLMRRKLHETPVFQSMREAHETLRDPIWILFKKHKANIIKAIGITVLETVAFNLIIPFSLIYLTAVLNVPFSQAVSLNLLRLLALVVLVPFTGKLASKIGAKKLAIWTAWGFLLLALPIYSIVDLPEWRITCSILLAILLACYWGATPALLAQLFPSTVRFSGVALGYNISIGIIGGFSPIAAMGFIHTTGSPLIPGIMLITAAFISLLVLKTVHPEKSSLP